MDATNYKIQKVISKIIICFTFIMLLHLLLSIVQLDSSSIIDTLIPNNAFTQAINIVCILTAVALSITWFSINKCKFKLKTTLAFFAICVIYALYFYIVGRTQNIPLDELFSNIKTVVVILVEMYFVLYVLSPLINKGHIKFLCFSLYILIIVASAYLVFSDFKGLIANFTNFNWYGLDYLFSFSNKNTMGVMIFVTALLCLYLYSLEKKKVYCLLYLFLFVPNIIFVCRTAIASMLILTLLLLFYFREQKTKVIIFKIFLIILFALSITLFLLNWFEIIKIPFMVKFIESLKNSVFGTIMGRYAIFVKSASLLNFSNVWLGNGYSSTIVALNELNGAFFHNSYIYLLNTGGIVLTFIYIWVFYRLFVDLGVIRKLNKHMYYILLVSLLTFCIYAMFENLPFFSFNFLSLISTIAIVSVFETTALQLKETLKREAKDIKNICFITTIYPTREKRWYGVYLHNLAKVLIKLGFNLQVIYVHEGKQKINYSKYDGVDIIHVYYKPSNLHKLMIAKGFDFKCDFEYIIKKYHFDDAIIHFYPPAFQNYIVDTLKNEGVQVLQYLHSRNIWKRVDEKHPLFRKLYYNAFYKHAYKKCDTFICVSKLVEADLKEKLKNAQTKVVYNGIDSIFFKKRANIKKFDESKINLLSVGNLYSIKGHSYVLKALKELILKYPDVKFNYVIIGNGVEKNNLLNLTQILELSNNVTYLNEISQNKIKQFFTNCDIFILPSYYEALGCVYLEAMARGCLTIGCKHQGIAEIITACNGYLVDERSVSDIINTISDIIENPKAQDWIRKNAIKTARKYTWLNSATELSKYL